MKSHNIRSQSGVAMVIVMVFLTLITMTAISGLSRIQLDEKIVQNGRDHSVAFSAAETALVDGELWIQSQDAIPDAVSSCTEAPCAVWASNALSDVWDQSHQWWQSNAIAFSAAIGEVKTQPVYIIEKTAFVPYELSPDAQAQGKGTHYYRVTARGTGESNDAQSIVESIFSIFYN